VVDLVVLLRAQPLGSTRIQVPNSRGGCRANEGITVHAFVRVLMHLLLESQGSPIPELMCAKSEACMLAARHTEQTKGFGT
jgi:hypothetical protein